MSENTSLSLEICQPIPEHAKLIMSWRNDAATLANSFHPQPKVWESFWQEYASSYFSDPIFAPLLALENGTRVGFLRFRPVRELSWPRLRVCLEVSIIVAPGHRGRGLGARLLRLAERHLAEKGVDDLLAEIRVANQASIASFRSAGYEDLGEAVKTIPDTGESCRIRRMVRRLTPRVWSKDQVFIIAEAGSNWRMGTSARDLSMGKALIDVAAKAGADAVKFQTYRPETVYVENAGSSDYLSKAGIKTDIREIFSDLAMPYELVAELASYAKIKNIEFMSTPFSRQDFAAVDPHVGIHKIASYEIGHPHLIELAARSGKPLVLSTGASDEADIDWAVRKFRESGGQELCLMQCTAKYPAPLESMNLRVIPWLKSRFQAAVGFSDHSRDPLVAPMTAVALGATVIEKHYTLDNRLPGPDHAFAVVPQELEAMVKAIREVEQALGSRVKEISEHEAELAAYAKRGLQATRKIKKGEILREGENLEILRPGKQKRGLHPKFLDQLNGKKASRDLELGTGISAGDWVDDAHE